MLYLAFFKLSFYNKTYMLNKEILVNFLFFISFVDKKGYEYFLTNSILKTNYNVEDKSKMYIEQNFPNHHSVHIALQFTFS